MNSERRRELLRLVTFNKTCFHSLELLQRWFLFFLFFYSYALFKQWYSLYSTRPLCYREAADRVKRNLSSPVVCWRIWFSRAGLKLLPGSKPGRTSVAAIHSQTWNISSGAVETVRRLSRHMHSRSANAGVLCILCTPGHRWWNKRLWLYFSSSTVICIFMSFPRKKTKKKGKERTHVMFAFICADVQSNSFFGDEIFGSTEKESMLLRIKKEVQIDHRWFQCMWFVLWNIWRKLFFNPEVSNRAPRFAAGSSPNQTLQQMMSQITSSRPDWSVKPPLDHFFWCIASHPCSLSPKKLPSRARTFLA